jgi:hypothetical protein
MAIHFFKISRPSILKSQHIKSETQIQAIGQGESATTLPPNDRLDLRQEKPTFFNKLHNPRPNTIFLGAL